MLFFASYLNILMCVFSFGSIEIKLDKDDENEHKVSYAVRVDGEGLATTAADGRVVGFRILFNLSMTLFFGAISCFIKDSCFNPKSCLSWAADCAINSGFDAALMSSL